MAVYSQQFSAIPTSQSNLLALNAILEEWLNEAQKAECESEISDALKARADYLTRVGDRVRLFM